MTTLKSNAMPMIRYNTDDIGKVSAVPCSCGLGLTVLKELEGRSGDILYLSNGKTVSPNYCCRLMMSPEFTGVLKQFQVIQTDGSTLDIKLVKTSGFRDHHTEALIGSLRNILGDDVGIRLNFGSESNLCLTGNSR